jgi:hypothetical protein
MDCLQQGINIPPPKCDCICLDYPFFPLTHEKEWCSRDLVVFFIKKNYALYIFLIKIRYPFIN